MLHFMLSFLMPLAWRAPTLYQGRTAFFLWSRWLVAQLGSALALFLVAAITASLFQTALLIEMGLAASYGVVFGCTLFAAWVGPKFLDPLEQHELYGGSLSSAFFNARRHVLGQAFILGCFLILGLAILLSAAADMQALVLLAVTVSLAAVSMTFLGFFAVQHLADHVLYPLARGAGFLCQSVYRVLTHVALASRNWLYKLPPVYYVSSEEERRGATMRSGVTSHPGRNMPPPPAYSEQKQPFYLVIKPQQDDVQTPPAYGDVEPPPSYLKFQDDKERFKRMVADAQRGEVPEKKLCLDQKKWLSSTKKLT